MKINIINNSINPTYKSIELKPQDKQKAEEYINGIISNKTFNPDRKQSSIALYKLFFPYISEEGNNYVTRRYPIEDVISDIKVRFWEFLYEIKPKNTVEDLIDYINQYKPFTSLLKPYQETKNLEDNVFGNKKLRYMDRLTERDIPEPQSESEIEKAKRELEEQIQNAEMSPAVKRRIRQIGKGLSRKELAAKEGISKRTVENSLKQGVLLIQSQKDKISGENRRSIYNVAKSLGIDFNQALAMALAKIEILSFNPDVLAKNLAEEAKIFDIEKKEFMNIVFKNPVIITRSPETINKNMESSAKLLGISKSDFIKMALKQTPLITQKPETLNKNVEKLANLLGVPKSTFVKLTFKNPELLYRSPKSLSKNVDKVSKIFKISKETFIKAANRQPQLLYLKPETLNKNVETAAKLLNVPKTDYINSALKQPELLYRKPQSVASNIEKFVNLFDIAKSYIVNIALKQPQLFYLNPETLNKNVENSARLLNISKKDFLEAALKQPQLFYLNPENLNKNAENTSKAVGITKDDFVKSALKQPTIFYLKAEPLEKKLNITKLYRKIRKVSGDVQLSSIFNKKESKLYDDILFYLIKTQKGFAKLSKDKLATMLPDLLKSLENPIEFVIPKDNMTEGFIKYAQEYSLKSSGKNMFKFIVK